MSEFTKQLYAAGNNATRAIDHFMKDKTDWWVPGCPGIDSPAFDEDVLDEPNDDWPTFDSDGGDMCTLLGFTWNKKGEIMIHAIIQMRREPNELIDIRLDDLMPVAACDIADGIPHEFVLAADPYKTLLENLVNADLNNDPASRKM